MDLQETNPTDSHYFGFLLRFMRPKVAIFFRKGCVFKIKILSSTFFKKRNSGPSSAKKGREKKLSINAGVCHNVRLRIVVILG